MIETRKFSSHEDFTTVSPSSYLAKKKEREISALDFPGLVNNVGNVRCASNGK